MSNDDNKAIMRRYWEQAFTSGNDKLLDELLAPDVTDHAAFPGQGPGRDGMKETIGYINSAFPDMKLTCDDVLADGDRAVARWRARGTHKGEFLGVPASNRPIDIAGISIFRIAGGKITDDWTQWDAMALMEQVGAMPAAGATA